MKRLRARARENLSDAADCILELLSPQNETAASYRRRRVGAMMIAEAIQALTSGPA